jgi:hypothetical protein
MLLLLLLRGMWTCIKGVALLPSVECSVQVPNNLIPSNKMPSAATTSVERSENRAEEIRSTFAIELAVRAGQQVSPQKKSSRPLPWPAR